MTCVYIIDGFSGLVLDAEGKHNPCRRCCRQQRRRRIRYLSSVVDVVCRIGSCVFWRLEKFMLWPGYKSPITFRASFRCEFVTYTRVYTVVVCPLHTILLHTPSSEILNCHWLKVGHVTRNRNMFPHRLVTVNVFGGKH